MTLKSKRQVVADKNESNERVQRETNTDDLENYGQVTGFEGMLEEQRDKHIKYHNMLF